MLHAVSLQQTASHGLYLTNNKALFQCAVLGIHARCLKQLIGHAELITACNALLDFPGFWGYRFRSRSPALRSVWIGMAAMIGNGFRQHAMYGVVLGKTFAVKTPAPSTYLFQGSGNTIEHDWT